MTAPDWQTQPDTPFMPNARPTSVTVVGIIGITLGSLGILCTSGSTIYSFLYDAMSKFLPQDLAIYGITTVVVSVLISVMIVIGSIGLLAMRPWARIFMIVTMSVDLIFDLAKFGIGVTWQLSRTIPFLQEMVNNPPPGMPPEKAQQIQQGLPYMRTIMTVSAGVTIAITAGFALIALIVLSRPKVKAAFTEPSLPVAPL
jgi:hypothetical protein